MIPAAWVPWIAAGYTTAAAAAGWAGGRVTGAIAARRRIEAAYAEGWDDRSAESAYPSTGRRAMCRLRALLAQLAADTAETVDRVGEVSAALAGITGGAGTPPPAAEPAAPAGKHRRCRSRGRA